MKLATAVDIYVLHRQATGKRFDSPSVALRAFSRRYGNKALQAVAPADVKEFLDNPHTGSATWIRKYGVLRNFFAYWRCRGKLNVLPIPVATPRCAQTFVPYIYSRQELRRLLDAVPRCQQRAACRISAITLRTLLLVLYGTGMRAGEALRLCLTDVDLENSMITVRGSKFYKSRLVPLGQDVVRILRDYLASPGRMNRRQLPLFQSRQHTHLKHSSVDANFRRLCILAGVHRNGTGSRQPRLHDLRHSFAVHRMTSWYRRGADVQTLLPALSTYLGHIDLRSTQCYLTMTPELLAEASQRFGSYAYGGGHEE